MEGSFVSTLFEKSLQKDFLLKNIVCGNFWVLILKVFTFLLFAAAYFHVFWNTLFVYRIVEVCFLESNTVAFWSIYLYGGFI